MFVIIHSEPKCVSLSDSGITETAEIGVIFPLMISVGIPEGRGGSDQDVLESVNL